ncbi:hypothetical protein BC938DRAFT_470515 [Jimgerdemannia flammicorona]|uniref:Uncharacterized protein n=1 Tax=Jimgerdemannia flammicorona TaxID=994334 RepID=A0A433QA15_9FUNG|nr:hypothetical protein BC938DRAFT_470515 [Jimgerdemannia flammicorona]
MESLKPKTISEIQNGARGTLRRSFSAFAEYSRKMQTEGSKDVSESENAKSEISNAKDSFPKSTGRTCWIPSKNRWIRLLIPFLVFFPPLVSILPSSSSICPS